MFKVNRNIFESEMDHLKEKFNIFYIEKVVNIQIDDTKDRALLLNLESFYDTIFDLDVNQYNKIIQALYIIKMDMYDICEDYNKHIVEKYLKSYLNIICYIKNMKNICNILIFMPTFLLNI